MNIDHNIDQNIDHNVDHDGDQGDLARPRLTWRSVLSGWVGALGLTAFVTIALVTFMGSASPARAGLPMTPCSPTSSVTGSGASARTWLVFSTVGTCTYTLPAGTLPTGPGGGSLSFDLVLVGGGGAGGWSDEDSASGGGGGGVASGTALPLSGSITVTVGAGGTGHQLTTAPLSANGGDSLIEGTIDGSPFSVTAFGGGRGAGYGDSGSVGGGGSSGGAHAGWTIVATATQGTSTGLTGISVFGNSGGSSTDGATGGGGGGASAVGGSGFGSIGGNGGEGLSYSIAGTARVLGSGGGGCGSSGDGLGGTNGGLAVNGAPGGNGVDGTGGGGGCSYNGASGSGGSGVVVLSYVAQGSPGIEIPDIDRDALLGRSSTGHDGDLPSTGSDSSHRFHLMAAAVSVIVLGAALAGLAALSRRRRNLVLW